MCELVLNGIGGTTIEEAEENLSNYEAETWMMYRETFGPLNHMLRGDRGSAMVASSMSGTSMDKLMPWPKELLESPDDAIEVQPHVLSQVMGAKKVVGIGQKFTRKKSIRKNKNDAQPNIKQALIKPVNTGKIRK